jgi:hypothetical protein
MLYIRNAGEIERGALALLGASTKSGDQIGKFGSGFKYALATLLREQVDFRIFSGLREIPITTEIEKFRDHEFKVLVIDGIRTSITTNTGPEWTVRDAIREIWSNAIDEGGAEKTEALLIDLRPGTTTIEIDSNHPSIKAMVSNWSMYFVHDVPALFEHKYRGRILEQPVPNFFRRGVWICEDRERTGIFSYDFIEIDLPESRKIKTHSTSYNVHSLLEACESEAVFTKILETRNPARMEWHALTYWGIESGSKGQKTLQSAFHRKWDFLGDEKNRDKVAKLAGARKVYWASSDILSALAKAGLPRIESEVDYNDTYTVVPFPIGFEDRLNPILEQLAKVGVNLTQFDIKFVEFTVDTGAIALADMKNKACLLSAAAFEAHPDMLRKALIEEWTHLAHGVHDCTVGQQHVYLNLIVDLIGKVK